MRRLLACLLLGWALLLAAAPASAHLTPNSVLYLDFGSQSVSAELLVPVNELEYRLGRKLDLRRGMAVRRPDLRDWLLGHIAVRTSDGRPWTIRPTTVDVVSDNWGTDLRMGLEMTPPPSASSRRFRLHYDAIIDRVPNHFVLVFARSDYERGILSSDPELIGGLQQPETMLTVDRGGGSVWQGFAAAVRLGMRHIAEGHDHLLFLIALILPAPLLASNGRWTVYGGARHAARRLTAVVTAFTIGHSVTLIGGAFFGWKLAPQPVEIGIALSILVSAIHAWRPIFAGREAVLSGGFGLIHGLAFATVIGDFVLEPVRKAQAILGFNLGIELVQLLVIACILPALLMLARTPSYRPFRKAGALLAGTAAIAWIIERATGAPNPVAESIDNVLGYAPWLVLALTLLAPLVLLAGRRGSPAASGALSPTG